MLGGSNNSLVHVFGDDNLYRNLSNASNPLQLFSNVPAACKTDTVNYCVREHHSSAFRSNKQPREADANCMQKKLQISLNHNFYHDDPDHHSSVLNPHHVSTGLKLSYDDKERNSSITSASASMTLTPSIMSSFGDSITTELDCHKEEFERYIMIQVLFDSPSK